MVRPANVVKSRACNQCKKKRIKCDLQSPTCQRCIQSNIPCSGPLSGLLMVNVDPSTFAAAAVKKSSEIPDRAIPPVTELVHYREPSPGLVYEDAMLWSFLSAFTARSASHTWEIKLPRMRSAKNAAAMKAAANAVSLVFAARSLNDTSMLATACEYYGQSLRYHQRSFVSSQGQNICKKKAFNALPVTLLLSYFEVMQPTSVDAWSRHTAAAERLLILMGPNVLNDDLLYHLYFIVRSNSLIRCFLTRSRTQLFCQPWSSIHASYATGCSTAVCDNLIGLVARLSDQLYTTCDIRDDLSVQNELTDLYELCLTFGNNIGLDVTAFLWTKSELRPLISQQPTFDLVENGPPEIPPPIYEPSLCLTAAYLHAAAVLLLTLLKCNAPEQRFSDHIIFSYTSYHSLQILSCAKHLSSWGYGCSALRMVLPVVSVYRYSPIPQHKTLAQTIFKEWSISSGLSGLCSVAFGEDPTAVVAKTFTTPNRPTLREWTWNQQSPWDVDRAIGESYDFQLELNRGCDEHKCHVCALE